MYGVLSGCVGGSDIDAGSEDTAFPGMDVLESLPDVGGVVKNVNVFTGSDMFREK